MFPIGLADLVGIANFNVEAEYWRPTYSAAGTYYLYTVPVGDDRVGIITFLSYGSISGNFGEIEVFLEDTETLDTYTIYLEQNLPNKTIYDKNPILFVPAKYRIGFKIVLAGVSGEFLANVTAFGMNWRKGRA